MPARPRVSKPTAKAMAVTARLSAPELARATGITVATLTRCVRIGAVQPEPDGAFPAATTLRLRRMMRLHRDLEVDLFAAAIIVDLMERLERIEVRVRR